MPRFAANLSFGFTEVPFADRFAAAAKAGFKAVEYMFPYEMHAEDIKALLDKHKLIQALFNLNPGNFAGGERGLAVLEGREEAFKASIVQGMRYAKALGVKQVHLMAGKSTEDRKTVMPRLIHRLRYACDEFGAHGVKVLIEAINPQDIPGYFISSIPQALEIIEQVNHPNLFLLYDVYHAQRTQGELARTLVENLHHIAHVQIADNPGRHEPGTGEINYEYVLSQLDKHGYQGWVGLEYTPSGLTEDCLEWIDTYGFKL